MARYATAQFCHLAECYLEVGEVVTRGAKIGKQGYSGYVIPAGPAGEHLHLGVVAGKISQSWSLDQAVPGGQLEPLRAQLDLFFGSDLYDPSADPSDKKGIAMGTYGWGGYKDHYAYDIIRGTGGRGPDIYWNRSMPGTVTGIFKHEGGKGLHVLIAYDMDYTVPVGKQGTVNYASVYLREKPDLSATVVGSVSKGDKVTILDTVRDSRAMLWYKVGDKKYIKSDFVS